jgi:AraC family transcriptional regulator, exoenzyme S synthesis regulatory protein ExsA
MRAVNFYEDIKGHPTSFRQICFKDILIAHYNCPQVQLKGEFYSHYNYISYTVSGEKRIHKSGKSWFLQKDVAIFAKKGCYLMEKFQDVEHCVMVFFIPDSYLQQFVRENRNQLPIPVHATPTMDSIVELDLNAITKAFFQSMLPYFSGTPSENLIELKFKELLLSLLTNPKNKSLLTLFNAIHHHQRPSLHEVMEENFRYNLGINDLAKIALRSLPTFKREFKETFHTTPGKWVLHRRLKEANVLLQSTSLSVNEIADECGFENNTHFSRVFKDEFGKSPLYFRKDKVDTLQGII